MSESLRNTLGIHGFTSGYLVDDERTVLFAQVNKGNFTDLGAAVQSFLQQGADGMTPNPQQLLPIGEPLPLANVPAEFQNALQDELSKPVTLVFLSDTIWCDTCGYWFDAAESFIKTWREQGYGLVLVKGGSKEFALETLSNGVVRFSDMHLENSETESQVLASWGMTGVPATLVLKGGVLQGEVAWLEVEVNGTSHRDIHFKAVEEVARTVAATAAEPRSTERR